MTTSGQQTTTPLERSPYPLAFVAAGGHDLPEPGQQPLEVAFRCEVMGLGGYQKEGLVEDLATGRTWRLACDEGTYLHGADMAPAPLMHWGAGLHADLTTRIARATLDSGLPLGALEVTVTQGFGAKGSLVRGEAQAQVYGLSCSVRIETDAEDAIVNKLVATAVGSSPAFAAMRNAIPGVFALYTNGRRTPVEGVPQSTQPPQADPFLRHATRPEPEDPSDDTSDLLTRRMIDSNWTLELPDDQDDAVQWRIHASGHYDPGTGLVFSEVGFPGGGGASAWTFFSDDTNRRAPHPLAYFSIGTAFCYHTQLARYAHIRRLPVEAPRLTQTTRFAITGTTATADPVDTQVFINGTVDPGQSHSLLNAAANICYAHRALSLPVDPAVSTSRHSRENRNVADVPAR
jgi:uncharacterized OsmC-like protein